MHKILFLFRVIVTEFLITNFKPYILSCLLQLI